MTITVPGIVPDMPDEQYHGDPVETGSLSSSGAKTLLKSPAHYQHERAHRIQKAAYDVGHAVHGKVLGVGMDVVVLDHDSYRTKAAQTDRDELYAAGKVPILAKDYAPIEAMAEAVLTHPVARAVFEREGLAEASIFGQDPTTGEWLRARPDFLPNRTDRRTVIGDLKTTLTADPREFHRAAAEYGYAIQSAFYQSLVRQVRGDEDTAFVFVLVEKEAPHLVSVVELTPEFEDIGRAKMRRAIDIYHQCKTTDQWPGYPTEIVAVEPPRWYAINEETEALT